GLDGTEDVSLAGAATADGTDDSDDSDTAAGPSAHDRDGGHDTDDDEINRLGNARHRPRPLPYASAPSLIGAVDAHGGQWLPAADEFMRASGHPVAHDHGSPPARAAGVPPSAATDGVAADSLLPDTCDTRPLRAGRPRR